MHRAHLVCDRNPPPSGNMDFPSLESYTNARKLGQDASESSAFAEQYTPYFRRKIYVCVCFFVCGSGVP